MAVEKFEDDDPGYEAWLAAHPCGWVVNARRSPSPTYLKLHRAGCAAISHLQAGYSRWTTGDYIKFCAERRDELDAWAQEWFAAELEDRCYCVQYGRRARSPATRRPVSFARTVPASSAPSPVAIDRDGFWSMETAGPIPFRPSDPALLHARAGLRSLLSGLTAQPRELLQGIIEGPAAAGTDLDNALLYNVGGKVNAAARYGVALERRAGPGTTTTRYRYRLARDPDASVFVGAPIVELDGVPLGRPPRTWPDVWLAVRTSGAARVLASAPRGDLALWLRVGAPGFAGAANGQFVKTIGDGVMTALHAHGDRATVNAAAERLARQLRASAGELARLLLGAERAVLGVCHRLIVIRGHGVQCQPQDGRIAALRIEIDRSASSWSLDGRLVTLDPSHKPAATA